MTPESRLRRLPANTLYRCEANNAVQVVKHCANGCAVHAATDDSCK